LGKENKEEKEKKKKRKKTFLIKKVGKIKMVDIYLTMEIVLKNFFLLPKK
jgi:hypothetical protein